MGSKKSKKKKKALSQAQSAELSLTGHQINARAAAINATGSTISTIGTAIQGVGVKMWDPSHPKSHCRILK